MKNILNYITEKWLPKEEWLKQRNEQGKKRFCAFNDYEEVTDKMVEDFWAKDDYKDKLIPKKNIRKEWQDAYETAKKNTAMLDYAMSSYYTVHFDKKGNLFIEINHGASWSNQNHLHHYADKCEKYFKLDSAAGAALEKDIWEPLYNKDRK